MKMSTRRAVSARQCREQPKVELDKPLQAGQGRSCDQEKKSSTKTPAKSS